MGIPSPPPPGEAFAHPCDIREAEQVAAALDTEDR